MKLARLGHWAERRATAAGAPGGVAQAILATLWAMLGFPLLWLSVAPMLGRGEDSLWYGSAIAALLSTAGYVVTLSLFRRWSR